MRRAAVRLAVAALVTCGIAVSLHALGVSSRRMLDGRRVEEARSGAEVFEIWRRAGVHGRVLLWFDRALPPFEYGEPTVRAFLDHPAALPEGMDEGFLHLALRTNLVRRVVYVVPDGRWEAFARAARERPDVQPMGTGFVYMLDGTPVVCVSAADRATALHEQPLVYLSARTREFFGGPFTDALLAGSEGADVVVVGP